MEDFSQSRGDDDLFDDEIVPFDAPPSPDKVAARLEQVSLEPTPRQPPSAPATAVPPAVDPKPTSVPTSTPAPAARDSSFPGFRAKPRGRGGQGPARGDSGRRGGGLADSKWAVKPTTKAAASTEVPKEEEAVQRQAQVPRAPAPEGEEVNETETSTRVPDEESASSAAAAAAPPSGPANATARPPAVSGDRTATGGVRKPKLTEEELTAKLAAAKERSQNVAAAHARAQADAASFEERERVAKAKREKDRVQRKAMDNEREKNRQHKMAVIGRREWDLGKDEQDFVTQNGRGGGRRFQSGTTPQQQYQTEQDDLRQYEWHDDRGRGRGGQGRGRGGGRGRGRDSNPPQQKSGWSAESDFPALPGSSSTPTTTKPVSGEPLSTESRPNPRRLDSEGDGGGGTWAEQVESSEAA